MAERDIYRELKIEIKAKTQEEFEEVLDLVVKSIKVGWISTYGSNETSSFYLQTRTLE